MPVGTPRFKPIQPNVKDLSQHLRAIYLAATREEATAALDRFEASGVTYPAIGPGWAADWDRLTALLDSPPMIRKVIVSTNAIESLNYSLRKALKNRGAFFERRIDPEDFVSRPAERLEEMKPLNY